MDAKWFCKIDDQEYGPLLIAQLRRLSTRGQLKANSFVRREDSDLWITAVDVPELQSQFGVQKSGQPRPKRRPVAHSIPVAAVAPPLPPAPETPLASEPGIQIVTHPTASHVDSHPVGRATGAEGLSRVMLAGLAGLGFVVVILLAAIVFLLARNDEPQGEQAADHKHVATDQADEADQAVKKTSNSKTTVTTARPAPPDMIAAVKIWSKPSSRLQIKSKVTRLPVCNVGIRSVWVSDDPHGEIPTDNAIVATHRDAPEKHVADDDVLDSSALGISKKKRVDVTGRIMEPEPESKPKPVATAAATAQPEADKTWDPAGYHYVFLQVSLSNASADEPLNYLGWNGDGESVQDKDAALFDQDGKECLFVSRIESPRDDRHAETTLAPGKAMVDVLVFKLPTGGFETLRLVLPEEAFGVSGYPLGYEISKSDIAGGPVATVSSTAADEATESIQKPPTRADLEREIQNLREDLTKPEDTPGEEPAVGQPAKETPSKTKRDPKEEFQDLKRLIEAEKESE